MITRSDSPTAVRHRGRRIALVLLLPVVLTLAVSPQDGAADTGSIEFVGVIEDPFSVYGPLAAPNVLSVVGDRLYAITALEFGQPGHLAVWDTSTEVPTALAVGPDPLPGFAGIGTGRTTFDSTRDRVTLGFSGDIPNQLLEYDAESLELARTTDVATILPGFFLRGVTYHEEADRYYLLGDMSASTVTAIGEAFGSVTRPGPAIVALDAETMSVAWVHGLPECAVILFDSIYGSLLGLGGDDDVLYAFCYGGSLRSAPAGQSTLLRVFIEPDATAADAATFRREVFPISGSYAPEVGIGPGVTAFDATRERLVVQSRSAATPGGWVFDGLAGAWVGFVAAPNRDNGHIGIDAETGRYYMGGETFRKSGYLNVTDVRATPPPQGRLFERFWIQGPVFADPGSDRLFTRATLVEDDPPVFVADDRGLPLRPIVVLRDTTPPILPLPPLDLDQFTVDLPDDRVRMDFTGASEGFGARYLLVGGVEGVTARTASLIGQPTQTLGLGTGDRGVLLAAVPRLDLRQAGVGGTGAVATVDQATVGDVEDTARDLGQNPEVFGFRDGMATCLDGNGEKLESTQTSDLGTAKVVCDLASLSGEVVAQANEGLAGGNVAVAGATFDTSTFHDPERGVVTATTATATGVRIGPEGGPNILMDRIVTVAETVANGRPGTTEATWERRVEGVSSDSGGVPGSCRTVVQAGGDAPTSGNCDALAAAINELAPKELEVTFPLPSLEATPKGAYASVEEREVDYLDALTLNNDQSRAVAGMQVEVRSDNSEKSRLFIEFAAIRANSTLTRTELPSAFDDGTGGGSGQQTSATSGGTGGDTSAATASDDGAAGQSTNGQAVGVPLAGSPVPDSSDGVSTPDVAGVPAEDAPTQDLAAAPAGQARWLVGTRSLGEAGTAAAVWLLFAWPMFVALRRRNLLTVS